MMPIALVVLSPPPLRCVRPPARDRVRRLRCRASSEEGVSRGTGLLSWAGGVVPQSALVGGAKAGWRALWTAMVTELAPQSRSGAYVRPKSSVASTDVRDSDTLVLYVGNTCPWCHRTTLALALRGGTGSAETRLPTVRVVSLTDDAERASRGGWVLSSPAGDPLFGARDLREVYVAACGGRYSGRCTAPLLVNARTRAAVSNDSAAICARISGTAAEGAVEALNAMITSDVNNAVYQSGFATSQSAYDDAQRRLWPALAALDARLARTQFLHGASPTSSDIFLYPTAVRFDAVYAVLFKCCAQRLADYPHLWRWMGEMHALPGVGATLDFEGMRRSYFSQLFPLNPGLICPRGPTAEQVGLGA